jgi:pre-rRNA-processing protein TSR3
VEALAAAFYITGFDSYANKLLSGFGWGSAFWEVNQYALFCFSMLSVLTSRRTFLERYKECQTAADITAIQERIIHDLERSWEESRRQKGCLISVYAGYLEC